LNIAKDTVVSLDVELSDIWASSSSAPRSLWQYLHGGYGNIFPAAEAALEGKRVKDRVEVRLEPEALSATTTKTFSESSRAALSRGPRDRNALSKAQWTATTRN